MAGMQKIGDRDWNYAKATRDWPAELPNAPKELIELIMDAMVDFGPDRHCDGAEEIAALVLDWMRKQDA